MLELSSHSSLMAYRNKRNLGLTYQTVIFGIFRIDFCFCHVLKMIIGPFEYLLCSRKYIISLYFKTIVNANKR